MIWSWNESGRGLPQSKTLARFECVVGRRTRFMPPLQGLGFWRTWIQGVALGWISALRWSFGLE